MSDHFASHILAVNLFFNIDKLFWALLASNKALARARPQWIFIDLGSSHGL